MSYYFTKVTPLAYEEAVEKARAELKKVGFGVITEIDVRKTVKEKLGLDFRKYIILGACNPPLAHQALVKERLIGTLLPCNLVVQEIEGGGSEVTAMNPIEAMKTVGNPELEPIGNEAAAKLKAVVESFGGE